MAVDRIRKKELVRFLFGGGSAVAVDFIAYQILQILGLHLDAAKAVSFICGSLVGFLINKLWTFECKKFSKGEIVRYVVLYACTAMVNSITNKLVLAAFPITIAGFFCATGISTILNFLGQKYFVFVKKRG